MFLSIALLILSQVYVSVAENDCAQSVYVSKLSWPSSVQQGEYQNDGELPLPSYFSSNGDWVIYPEPWEDPSEVAFGQLGDAEPSRLFYLAPRPEQLTCFPYGLNETFNAISYATLKPIGTLHLQTQPKVDEIFVCEPCKQVLDGPLAGNYSLYSSTDDRCEDGCLYSNDDDTRFFCFEAGPFQVLLECPWLSPFLFKSFLNRVADPDPVFLDSIHSEHLDLIHL